MSEDGSQIENGVFIGVDKHPDGSLDLSRAGRLIDEPQIPRDSLQALRQKLAMVEGSPLERKAAINFYAKQNKVSAEVMLDKTRLFTAQEIRDNEKGTIYHFHRINVSSLEDVLKDGALHSMESQKRMGRSFEGTGSRPDVVQMTRDRYDKSGNLIRRGLGDTNRQNNTDRVTFVFKPTVMDLPGYEATSVYPNLPSIPLNAEIVEAVLVPTDNEKMGVENAIKNSGLQIPVKTEADWVASS